MKTAKIEGRWGRWAAAAPSIQNLPKGAEWAYDELQATPEAADELLSKWRAKTDTVALTDTMELVLIAYGMKQRNEVTK